MCCELCKPNTTERKFGLDNCRMSLCSCHTTPPTYDKYKDDCPKCGATAFRGCLHKGYLTPEVSTPPTPSGEKLWETEFAHLAVANLLREKDPIYGEENRQAKQQLKEFIRNLLSSRLTEIRENIIKKEIKLAENYDEKDYSFNCGLYTALQIIKEAREK